MHIVADQTDSFAAVTTRGEDTPTTDRCSTLDFDPGMHRSRAFASSYDCHRRSFQSPLLHPDVPHALTPA